MSYCKNNDVCNSRKIEVKWKSLTTKISTQKTSPETFSWPKIALLRSKIAKEDLKIKKWLEFWSVVWYFRFCLQVSHLSSKKNFALENYCQRGSSAFRKKPIKFTDLSPDVIGDFIHSNVLGGFSSCSICDYHSLSHCRTWEIPAFYENSWWAAEKPCTRDNAWYLQMMELKKL